MKFLPFLFISIFVAGCSQGHDTKSTAAVRPGDNASVVPPSAAQVKVEAVQSAVLPTSEVHAPGRIEVNPGFMSKVALPLAGRIVKVMVTVGDFVRQGKPLLVLDSPDTDTAVSNYRQAIAKVAGSKSGVAKAEADLGREQDLFAHGAVAQKDVLSAQAQLTQANSDLAQANAAEEETTRKLRIYGIQADGNNDEVLVPAPVSGKVLDLSVAAGEYRNDTSAPVMTIADLSSVYMSADVPETSIRFTRVGEQVVIRFDGYPDEQFTGRVTRIGDTVDPTTRTIKVRALLKNPDGRFRPDMFGQLEIKGLPHQVVTVPASAVVQTSNRPLVYRQSAAGSFDPVPVTLGERIDDRVAILSGLRPADKVVTDGSMLLRSNTQ